MPLAPGTRLGRYEVRSQLGAGGMGEVYLARDTTELERLVAVKVLPADVAADPERMRRFIQEAKTASSLNHPNILTIHEIGEANSSRFIAAEYVEGETLRRRMTRSRLTLREALDIAIQMASALVAAHKAGVVHRDIKPENVMVREDGIAKVLDFGLAKPTGRPANQPTADGEAETRALVNTSPGLIVGTVAYMSPEQARGLQVDERTDIWSLGVVIYEMVTGRLPFAGDTPSDVLAHILTKEPGALALTSERANERLDEIVQKALAKDREERYQHAKDLLIDLRRLKQKLDVEAEIERTNPPEARAAATRGAGPAAGGTHGTPAARTAELSRAHPTSSAEYVVSEIRRHKGGAVIVLATLVLSLTAASYLYFARSSKVAVRSIAVLPFQNAGGDPGMEYLSDGISESLINSLSQLPDVRVLARSTMFRFKGQDADPQAVGRRLGVDAVLSGRVVQFGDSFSVQADLVNAADGSQMWGERYSRKASDIFAVQEDIAREIVGRLRLKLSGEQEQRVTKRYTENPEAYQLYLKGRFQWNKRSPEGLRRAVDYFKQAVTLDPDYALAYSGLADCYSLLPIYDGKVTPVETLPQAKEAALKALALDDGLAEAHTSLALVFDIYDYKYADSEQHFRRALELNPNYMIGHLWYGELLVGEGRFDEGLAEVRRALELDPLSLAANYVLGLQLNVARRYDEAIRQYQKTLELDPNFAAANGYLADTYANKGLYAEAVAAYLRQMELDGAPPSEVATVKESFARSGWPGFLRQTISYSQSRGVPPHWATGVAASYARLGDRDKALAWLEKAYAVRSEGLTYLKVDPRFDNLRSDPGFNDLMRRVGLPQ